MIDSMVSISSEKAHTSKQDLYTIKRARCLVAEYLRDWGMRDPDVVAAESLRIVNEAEGRLHDLHAPITQFAMIAIEMAQVEVESCISKYTSSPHSAPKSRSATRDSIVPQLSNLLLKYPEAICPNVSQHSEQMQTVVENSINPIIPRVNHRAMRPQPRTRLFKIFRKGYWVHVHRRVTHVTLGLMGIK
ncbi:hypothetical protein SH668x_002712 [Planctomicrobium sp. SH668]|uniref:hypothetical protein n=1 Tax=Planctomicrobium sp. SH668 TaxID=3448126 RepID=UPI003F5C2C81